MPRIPQDELDRLKAEVDLAALIRAKGIELKPHGEKDLIGRCPFHHDKTPSLVVTPAKALWHCMGACQMGGDVVSWVMKADGVSFRHAVELLKDGKAKTLLTSDKVIKVASVPKLSSPLEAEASDAALLGQVVAYYHTTLQQSPEALAYLTARGLNTPEVIETFRLGFSNRTLGLRLPEKNREAGAQIRARLEALGVFRASSGHEHLRGSLTIPILDDAGDVLGLYGRKIRDDLKADIPRHLYLPGPHRGVFNPACLQSQEIILCEALIDALSFWAHGFKNVTASYGIEGFTEEMLAAFLKHGVKRIYIAYDRDEAGDRAAEKLAHKLLSEGIEVLRVLFPHNMDANEYIRKVSPPEKALGVLLNAATWIGKGGRAAAVAAASPAATPIPEPSSPLAAPAAPSPAAAPAAPDTPRAAVNVPCQVQGEDVLITLGERLWRVRGLAKNLSYEVMRVNLRVSLQGTGGSPGLHVDQLDLYNSKHRENFVARAAEETGEAAEVLKRDLGRILLKLEALQEEKIKAALAPEVPTAVSLSDEDRKAALAFLRSPDLLARIGQDVEAFGYVGEETNKLVAYLAATSRKLDDPLGVVIQSSSAAGKSSLMDAVLAFMPEEEKVKYSALTGQALFYMQGQSLKHTILAIVEDAGAEKASYALKLLISEKELSIASAGKDPETGKQVTEVYHVEGPAAVFYATTRPEIDPELQNRCLVLSISEERGQTRAIHERQRRAQTLEGMKEKKARHHMLTVHHNAQRLLRPLAVVNPYAPSLTFLDDKTRLRRDHMKYLGLMNVIALLHQYQREVKHDPLLGDYVEVTLADIETANRLAAQVLGRSLDELAPQTRRLLVLLHQMAEAARLSRAVPREAFRFSRKDIRAFTGLSDFQVRIHLDRLVSLEYVLAHRGTRGQSYVYELLYDGEGQDGAPFLLGLMDAKALQYTYDSKFEGVNAKFEGQKVKFEPPLSPESAPVVGGVRSTKKPAKPTATRAPGEEREEEGESLLRSGVASRSYHTHNVSSFSA
jgi:DNA primase catalytic core